MESIEITSTIYLQTNLQPVTVDMKNQVTSNWKYRILMTSLRAKSSNSGFSLIEALVSIVVVSVLLTGIAPMVALATATRVQARRIDLATQAARTYLDGVRGCTVPIPQKFVKDPTPAAPTPSSPTQIKPSDFAAPLAAYGTTVSLRDPGTAIDTNNNGFSINDPQDLVIQPLRNNGGDATPNQLTRLNKEGFQVVVRVYRADAFAGNAPTKVSATQSIFTATNGSRNYPLVVTSAQVFLSCDSLNKSNLTDMTNGIPSP